MSAALKHLVVVMMAVMPGGLVLLAAFVLARLVAERMRAEQGPQSHRFARAVAQVRWGDVVRGARASL
jgi:hypothetical protein